MTYNEAYNKIIEAYFRNEIKPNSTEFCFCGTLSSGRTWINGNELYSKSEYKKMEIALFSKIPLSKTHSYYCETNYTPGMNGYEDYLFSGMSAALDVLRQIHIERGEVIDETPVFTKRNLTHA